MVLQHLSSARRLLLSISALLLIAQVQRVSAQNQRPSADAAFHDRVQPLLKKYCERCHTADNMESGIRVDQLTAAPADRQLFLLKDIQRQVSDRVMPPEDEPQPSADERKTLTDWISGVLHVARTRPAPNNGTVRRLTVAQYRNTLRDLLGLQEDLTDILPPDGISQDGFTNQRQTLELSPLQVESYFDIAEQALDQCIVDESAKPVIQNFRVDLGAGINPKPCPDDLVLGALSHLLANQDVLVTELKPAKPFAYEPFAMRTKYRFIEGYAGNDTVRGWKEFDSIYHAVFACMRGTNGYPQGEPHRVVPEGLLLRPALPSSEIFGQSSTYGPMANFKISLRELPRAGNFRITVNAARYDDALLLKPGAKPQAAGGIAVGVDDTTLAIKEAGVYQVDVDCSPGKPGLLMLMVGERHFSAEIAAEADKSQALLLLRLPAGELKIAVGHADAARLKRLVFTRLPPESELAKKFEVFDKRQPLLGVHLGLRRDCGSTLARVAAPVAVADRQLQTYVFAGAINDFPRPEVEEDNVNYLAGLREIGVRSEPTDGRDMPRLLIRSVEFEGPYYATWPPETHRRIFIESRHRAQPNIYAREIIQAFAARAFRRPVTDAEVQAIVRVWQQAYEETKDFRRSIKDALTVVLTSPQFLFLIEQSGGPHAEDLTSHELASKLSYFLWNAPPDQRVLELAEKDRLHGLLDAEIDRMIQDERFVNFAREFASQWLALDKFDVVAVDAQRYPRLTRDVKAQLREEPVHFLGYLIEHNLSLSNLIESDFVLANEVVADYYELSEQPDSGLRFVPIKHQTEHLGGVLAQASILAGLSDGRESNPVKRGAWLARKIIAEPPDDPPPNVPELPTDEAGKRSLRERLERHRAQQSCAKCHAGIDPWGLPLESLDAGGRWKREKVDASSTLPDGTEVRDFAALKRYLAVDRIDTVAFSFLKHVATYAAGRSLTYHEIVFLQEEGLKSKAGGYRARDLLRCVVRSDIFLKK